MIQSHSGTSWRKARWYIQVISWSLLLNFTMLGVAAFFPDWINPNFPISSMVFLAIIQTLCGTVVVVTYLWTRYKAKEVSLASQLASQRKE